jgi:hypothetical protein
MAKFVGKIMFQVLTASFSTYINGCTEKILMGPWLAHFMFLSTQSLKGSTLVKAVERR